MSIEDRRTKTVYAVIQELVRNGQSTFRPGDVATALRDRGRPLDTWEVRWELSILEASGLIELNAESGAWSLSEAGSKQATG